MAIKTHILCVHYPLPFFLYSSINLLQTHNLKKDLLFLLCKNDIMLSMIGGCLPFSFYIYIAKILHSVNVP